MANEKKADEYKEILKYSFLKHRSSFEEMLSLQRLYDNVIDPSTWPTESNFGLAYLFTAVHDMLPKYMDYCFPDMPIVSLLPRDATLDVDQVRKVERLLHDTVLNKMQLKKHGYKTLQSCMKLGVGIGIIEPAYITPLKKKLLGDRTFIAPGSKEMTWRYRNVNPAAVVPYPDGSDFNGSDAVSISFMIDYYHEDLLRNMHKEQPDEIKAKWDPEKIIEEARSKTFDIGDDMEEYMKKIGGKKVYPSGSRKNMPVNVPVLKCYEADRHVWFALGQQIIYDTTSEIQTFRNPMVKASAWPDGDRFYPMSISEALKRPALAHNIFINMIYDMMTWNMKRPFMYNSDLIDDPQFGPDGRIKVGSTEDVRKAGAWLEPPGIGNDTMAVGEKIQQLASNISGHKDYTDRNFTRGGMGAFRELLGSMDGREKMAAAVIETGWQLDVYTQTLINIQNTLEENADFVVADFNEDGKKRYELLTVTPEDIRHVFNVSLDAKGVSELAMTAQEKMQMYQTYRDDPMANPYELRRVTSISENVFRRIWKSKAEMDRIQEENRQMELQERQNGINQGQQGQSGIQQGAAAPQGPGVPPAGI